MKLIAHRGLIYGKDAAVENTPQQINLALSKCYDVEVDLWIENGRFLLGHDYGQHEVSASYLHNERFWIHAKNFEALQWLTTTNLNYFWHQSDEYTITSHGYIWTYPKGSLSSMSVCVMPELFMSLEDCKHLNCHAICSDFIEKLDFLAKK